MFFKSGIPQKGTLIFAHGFMGNHQDWDFALDYFSKNYLCLTFDLPGHSTETEKVTSFPEFRDYFSNEFEKIDPQTKPIFIWGYSMGGRLILDWVTHTRPPINGLILESVFPGFKTHEERLARITWETQTAKALEEDPTEVFLTNWYNTPMWGPLTSIQKEKLIQTKSHKNTNNLANSFLNFASSKQENNMPFLETSPVPTLYLSGHYDKKYTEIGKQLASLPHITHRILKNAGHNCHFQSADETLQHIQDFFRGRENQ